MREQRQMSAPPRWAPKPRNRSSRAAPPAGSVTGGVTVTGNSVVALGYGNSASNAIALTGMYGGLNSASALLNNTQTNSANISTTLLSSPSMADSHFERSSW